MRFDIRHFDELTAREVYDVMHLRDLVFVVGQKITAVPEVDGLDPQCAHARVFVDDLLVGTARIFVEEDPLVVGRIAVHPDLQRSGVGSKLMWVVQEWLGEREAELHAQSYLDDWYTQLGWTRFGDEFMEAEIPHLMMRWIPRDTVYEVFEIGADGTEVVHRRYSDPVEAIEHASSAPREGVRVRAQPNS